MRLMRPDPLGPSTPEMLIRIRLSHAGFLAHSNNISGQGRIVLQVGAVSPSSRPGALVRTTARLLGENVDVDIAEGASQLAQGLPGPFSSS